MQSFWRHIRVLLSRDIKTSFRSGGGWFYALLFYAIFAGLAGLTIGPSLNALSASAPALIWLAAAFAIQFSVADIFDGDVREGFLRVYTAEHDSLAPYIGAKFLLLAITVLAPMIVATPVILIMFGVQGGDATRAALLLTVGAPALLLGSLFAAALAAGLRAGGMLAMVISAPLIAPVLIFGALATKKLLAGEAFWSPEALLLAALALFLGAVTPMFSILALRAGLE